jgi:hypothetical protein
MPSLVMEKQEQPAALIHPEDDHSAGFLFVHVIAS